MITVVTHGLLTPRSAAREVEYTKDHGHRSSQQLQSID